MNTGSTSTKRSYGSSRPPPISVRPRFRCDSTHVSFTFAQFCLVLPYFALVFPQFSWRILPGGCPGGRATEEEIGLHRSAAEEAAGTSPTDDVSQELIHVLF